MISTSFELLERLPPLKKRRRPNIACLVGFLFGGIGLAIYFRTFVDFILLLAFEAVALIMLGSSDPSYAYLIYFLQCAIAGLYGFFRAETSNRMLEPAGGAPRPAAQPAPVPTPRAAVDEPIVLLKRHRRRPAESDLPIELKRRGS
jgi:hypothetical protein